MITDPKDPKSVVDPDPNNFERYPGSASASNKKQDPDQSDKLDPEPPGSDQLQMTSQNVWNVSLFEHLFTSLIL
jgi:hypothetical protein